MIGAAFAEMPGGRYLKEGFFPQLGRYQDTENSPR